MLNRFRVRWLAAIITFAVVIAARAQPSSQSLDTFQSKSFQISTDATTTVARPIAKYMDVIHSSYRRFFPSFAPRNSQRSTIYVMRSRDSYLDLLGSYGMDGRNTGGVFFASAIESGLATWVDERSRYRLKNVLQHEGFHQFAATHIAGNFPIWANEGLAEYFGYGILVRNKLETGLVPSRPLRRVRDAIEKNLYLSFDDLLRMDGREWGRRLAEGDSRAAVAYDQAWSVVHFLMHAGNGKYAPAFFKFIKLTANGMDIDNALKRAFGSTNFEPFERAWKQYIAELKPDPLSMMVERLAFLAEGIRALDEGGEQVTSLEELKTKLRAADFKQQFGSHGGTWTMSASDDAPFQVPAPDGRRRPITLELKAPGRGLPLPYLEVGGLQARVRTVWVQGADGTWQSDVVIR